MSMNGIEYIQVKYIRDNAYGFVKNQVYRAFKAKSKFGSTEMICIVEKSGEEYAYPASWFEIIELSNDAVQGD